MQTQLKYPLDFTLGYFYNSTEKSTFLRRRKRDFEEFYRQNYFDQQKIEIVTKPIQFIEFISSGIQVQPFEQVSLGIKLVNLKPTELIRITIQTSYGRLINAAPMRVDDGVYFISNDLTVKGNRFKHISYVA